MINWKLIAFFFFLIASAACSDSDEINEDPGWEIPDSDNKKLSVMSYNIRHCAPYYGDGEATTANVNNIADVISVVKPDVVFLQEVDKNTTRSLGIDQAKKIAELVGYPSYHFYKMMDYRGGEYGIAILSSYELKDAKVHIIPSIIEDHEIAGNNILGTAKITVNEIDITLAVVHLSVYQTDRDKQLPYILNEILANKKQPILFAGDFNAVPGNYTIQLLDDDGFVRTNNDPKKFTIPSNDPNRELDYICYKPESQFSVRSHTVMTGISASDHLPIVSVLNIKN